MKPQRYSAVAYMVAILLALTIASCISLSPQRRDPIAFAVKQDDNSSPPLEELAEIRSGRDPAVWLAPNLILVQKKSGQGIEIWEIGISTVELLWEKENPGYLHAAAVSPDGTMLALGFSTPGLIQVVHPSDGTLENELIPNKSEQQIERTWVNSLAFSPDGQHLVAGINAPVTYDTIQVWQTDNWLLSYTLAGHEGLVDTLHFSPNGDYFASGSSDGTVRLWRVSDGAQVAWTRSLGEGPSDWTKTVVFSPDDSIVASGSGGFGDIGYVGIWSVPDLSLTAELVGHTSAVMCLAFSPKGGVLASASADGTVKLWDTSEWTLLVTINRHKAVADQMNTGDPSDKAVWYVSFSPDGRMLATAGEETGVFIWRPR